jgi:hypothetical protein
MRESRARPRKQHVVQTADQDDQGSRRKSPRPDGAAAAAEKRVPRSPAVCAACHTFFFEQIKRFQQLYDGETPLERNDNNHRRAFADFYETVTRSRASMRCEPDRVSRMLGYLAWKLKTHKVIKFPRPGVRSSSPSPSPDPFPILQQAASHAGEMASAAMFSAAAPAMGVVVPIPLAHQQQRWCEWVPATDTATSQALRRPQMPWMMPAAYGLSVGAMAPTMMMIGDQAMVAMPVMHMDQWALASSQQWKQPHQQQQAIMGMTYAVPVVGTGFTNAT